jgi:LacI family repressor for deo operon, udp, cdd, tsx, nupC, and nupG
VIGFDDVPLAAHSHPTLTTIRQPIYDIGKKLSQILIEIIKGEEPAERQIILRPELVVRESSGVR